MTDQSKTESKVQKHVEDAVKKIETLTKWSPPPGDPQREQLREILSNLALRSALAGLPDKCKECDEKLDTRLSVRCPKHIGFLMLSNAARSKVKEHGPALLAKAAMGAQEWFEKITAEKKDDEDGNESEKT